MSLGDRSPRLAVLIDADNTSAKIVDGLFEEIAKIGEASVRRIYGDFSSARSKSWAAVLAQHAIIPLQQFAYTTGKNASDITLVIDAMDLLHSGRLMDSVWFHPTVILPGLQRAYAKKASTSSASENKRRRRVSGKPAAGSSTRKTSCRPRRQRPAVKPRLSAHCSSPAQQPRSSRR